MKGQKFGDWTLEQLIGQGGNGFVWQAVNSKSEKGAIKILAKMKGKNKAKVYSRFRDEVKITCSNNDIEGVLPIIDYFLPDEINGAPPWYVMPVAEPFDKYLINKSFENAIKAVLEIGKTLTILHSRGISHRDIKPANLLFMGDKAYLADFGLVDYPDKKDVTIKGESVGAKWTIAPEMKREGDRADGKPADVYSLAKTLWILLTGKST